MKIICLTLLMLLLSACSVPVTVEDRRTGQALICHNNEKTLSVPSGDFHRHQQHGDEPGPCPDEG